jgi:hypothetical protein
MQLHFVIQLITIDRVRVSEKHLFITHDRLEQDCVTVEMREGI